MKYQHNRPGPIGKSCLTCRQRRKKCDLARPSCERCRKGKFECLGYDCLADSDKSSESPSSEDLSYGYIGQVPDVPVIRDNSTGDTNITVAATTSPPSSTLFDSDSFDDPNNTPPITYSPAPVKSFLSRQSLFSYASSNAPHNSLVLHRPETQLDDSSGNLEEPGPLHHLNGRTLSLLLSMQPGISWVPADIMDMTNFFMARFERLISMSFFKPAYQQILRIRETVNWRLQNFVSTRWAMFMCTKLFDSVLEGNPLSERDTAILRYWMSKIEQLLYSTPVQYLTSAEVQKQLSGSLELALFRLRADGTDTYELLKNYAPTFLQIVFSDPTLWPNSHNSTSVSLAHVLASMSYEISQFAMLDTMCSMLYGLPQVVDYDTSMSPFDPGVHPELVHGCPLELQILLADINTRNAWKQIGPMLDWHDIEQRLREWRPTVHSSKGEDSWKPVARLAVQEGWRHTLLIYLYMAVCDTVSNEARVETSVRQVFQIIGTVKHELQPVANSYFFMQYLMAGAFTPNERYRALAREKLSDGVGTKFWLLNISTFVPVLDHLWHGAAANGRPIRWSDYVRSRQIMIPVRA